jgi:UDP-glucose 4-epimerase
MEEWIRNQSFCITGGSGALGSSLLKKLIDSGAQNIVILDQRDPLTDYKEINNLCVDFIKGSILNKYHVSKAVKRCSVLFHLAALIHAGNSALSPLSYMKVNCLGTFNVLEACREQGVPQVIYTSTGHVYGRPCEMPVNEDHSTIPLSLYAASKLAGESLMHAYAASFGISTIIARLANLYSELSVSDTVIGCALDQVSSGQGIELRNLSAVRDFLHIEEAAEALIRLAMVPRSKYESLVVNVSPGYGVSVGELCEVLADIAEEQGMERPHIIKNMGHYEEQVTTLILDNRLLKKLVGWTPQITLREGLSRSLWKRLSGSVRKS